MSGPLPRLLMLATAILLSTAAWGARQELSSEASLGLWPQWRGPSRSGQLNESLLAADRSWPAELEKVWQVPAIEGTASPVVSQDAVYLLGRQGNDEWLRAYSLDKGELKWEQSYAAPMDEELTPRQGPASTPAIAGNKLFALGSSGILGCYELETGKCLWQKQFAEDLHSQSLLGRTNSPLLDGENGIVHVDGGENGSYASVRLKDGQVQWRWNEDVPSASSPVLANFGETRQLVILTQSACVGLDLDGKLLWRIPFEADDIPNTVTPVLYDESIILASRNHGVTRYRIELRDNLWQTDEVWRTKEVNVGISTPVVSGDRLYGFSQNRKGELFALDLTTGKLLWQSPGKLGPNASLVRSGSIIWAVTTKGEMLVFADNEKEFCLLHRYQVSKNQILADPALVRDGILIRDSEQLTRWRVPSSPAPQPEPAKKEETAKPVPPPAPPAAKPAANPAPALAPITPASTKS